MSVERYSPERLGDHLAITEVIHRYCRGMDRMDKALTLSCWHLGGTDDHAPLYSGSAEGFVEWLWPVHEAMQVTRHVVSNILIDIDGDKAGSETYWNVLLRVDYEGRCYDIFGGGRYLDRFECIDGKWAIRHRQSVHDWDSVALVELTMSEFETPPLIIPNNPEAPMTPPARNQSDLSYQILSSLHNRLSRSANDN